MKDLPSPFHSFQSKFCQCLSCRNSYLFITIIKQKLGTGMYNVRNSNKNAFIIFSINVLVKIGNVKININLLPSSNNISCLYSSKIVIILHD